MVATPPGLNDLRYAFYGRTSDLASAEYAFMLAATAAGVTASKIMSGAYAGSGSPEGVVTAPVGSMYRDTTNGVAYMKATGAGNTGWVAISSSSGTVNVQEFTATGAGTWTKPAGATLVTVILIGAGGGGASGYRGGAGTLRPGGGGGGAGTRGIYQLAPSDLAATETVTVGTGGTGGAGKATDGVGNDGTAGGDTIFTTTTRGGDVRGKGGTQGSHLGGLAPGFGGGGQYGSAGAALSASTGNNVLDARLVAGAFGGGGGGGWSKTAADALIPGGVGGASEAGAGGATANPGGAGTAGYRGTSGSGGGGGGVAGTPGGAIPGGAGGAPGGGGGGGCFATTGATSGAGGDGAKGYALIITV